jgi:hypothetical protein
MKLEVPHGVNNQIHCFLEVLEALGEADWDVPRLRRALAHQLTLELVKKLSKSQNPLVRQVCTTLCQQLDAMVDATPTQIMEAIQRGACEDWWVDSPSPVV